MKFKANKIEGTPIPKLKMTKKIIGQKKCSKKLKFLTKSVTKIHHNYSLQEFLTKIRHINSTQKIVTNHKIINIFICPILVVRSSACPACGRRA